MSQMTFLLLLITSQRRKKNYHNRGRHFTNPDQLNANEEREKREKAWKKKQGIEDSESEEEAEEEKAAASKSRSQGEPGELPPSDSEEETDSDEDDGRDHRPKGVQHLIETANPNHIKQKSKKVTELEAEGAAGTNLTRKQKEEVEKQQARERYMKAHLAGKTEEARADMARLAIIRKTREDAARKKAEEKALEDAKKKEAENKLLEKRKVDKSK